MENNETSNQANTKIKTVEDCMKKDAIIWFTNQKKVSVGIVKEVYAGKKQAYVFNYSEWTYWMIDYDRVIRVNNSYWSDEYREHDKPKINESKTLMLKDNAWVPAIPEPYYHFFNKKRLAIVFFIVVAIISALTLLQKH